MRNRFVRAAGVAVASIVFVAAPANAGGAGCDADLDGSGLVDFNDLLILLASWGPCPGCSADLDGNNEVDFVDLLSLLSAWDTVCVGDFVATEIVGEPLSEYPWFNYVMAFNENVPVTIAVDPSQYGFAEGATADAYVVANKTAPEWAGDPSLSDVRGAPQTVALGGPDIQDATVELTGDLDGSGGTASFGIAYDLVLDFNQNGMLDGGDIIDGLDGPGFTVFQKLTGAGPYSTSNITYSGGSLLGQKTYYPTDIGSMGELPLIIMSHGNGHQYTWYDYLGTHLASYGYIFMSHQNNTGPGIETASTTTLTNTDYILENQGTIGGGVLNGHIDEDAIVWLGHSRGGEGIVRAYNRVQSGSTPGGCCSYTADQIVLLSSVSPTDFGGAGFAIRATPDEVDYHMIYGSSDGDVSGSPGLACCMPFRLLERAEGMRSMTYLQGADHNDFNCCGFNDFQGPAGTQIGRPEAQAVTKAAYIALLENRLRGEVPPKDFLTRQYEDFRSTGISDDTVVDSEWKDDESSGKFVIDDFQSGTSLAASSSGGAVSGTVSNRVEGRMDDANTSLTWLTSDPWNGMTRAEPADFTRGTVFDWNAESFLEFEVIPSERDVTDRTFLSLRACQGSRHPNTQSVLDDLTFTVVLRDGDGTSSSINIGAYEGGIEQPYQRTGSGSGAGWANEFETIRIRLTDFLTNGSGLDLTDIEAVRLEFGASFGDTKGRIGLDDLELLND